MYRLLIFLVLAFSCQKKTEQPTTADTPSPTVAFHDSIAKAEQALAANQFPFDSNFYRHYEGTVAGKHPITAEIIKIGDKVRGYYQYGKQGIPLSLAEGSVKTNGAFKVQESDFLYNTTGTWVAAFKGDMIEGIWISADSSKRLALSLKEIKSPDALPFEVFYQEKVALLKGDDPENSPKYTFISSMVYPAASFQGPAKASAQAFFDGVFGEAAVKGNPNKSIEMQYKKAVKDYMEANKPFMDSADMSFALNWSNVSHFDVVYNANGIFSGSLLVYEYTGGAHGNYGRALYVLDVPSGKPIKAKDIFKGNYKQGVRELIMREIRKADGLPANASLAENGYYEEEIAVTDNFYATNKGIGFYYSPYQIAAYARGGVEIFIPYKDCMPYLNPQSPLSRFFQAL